MARVISIECDACGSKKEEANHWFFLSTRDEKVFELTSFNNIVSEYTKGLYLCGATCVQKKLSHFMDEIIKYGKVTKW